ncbi:MAG: cytochrome c3 family protein [Chloroflexi bacterium]|nr:cytochrome c3 family protein [Chloroflexota bacterium]
MPGIKKIVALLGFAALFAILAVACSPREVQVEVTREVEVTRVVEKEVIKEVTPAAPPEPAVEIPFEVLWAGSGHADAAAEPFRHWDDTNPVEVPATCAKCHTPTGFVDFIGADGSEAGKVDKGQPPADQGITCVACHNDGATVLSAVTFPSGKVVEGLGPEARCMTCHQGRESKASVDKQINETFKVTDMDAVVAPIKDANGKDVRFGFRNIHHFAAGATLYGAQAQGVYEYDGKVYDPRFRHVEVADTCLGCHNQHSLEVRVEKCQECHTDVKTVEDLKTVRMNGSLEDYNGNGDIKEGVFAELKGLQEILYSSIQAYAKEVAGVGITYDPAAYPYFFADADGDGKPDQKDGANVRYATWTARLLKAAYNYQVSVKDPGAFAHNSKYIIELLYDSTEDLNAKLARPVDMGKLHRNDAGHFAGNTEPFRHWDERGRVPASCSKCHSATGLPQFLAEGANLSNPIANGFMCTTCHDAANWPARYGVTSVPFPSGAKLTFSTEKDDKGNLKPVDANLCILCHQGRESTVSVNNAVKDLKPDEVSDKLGFRNIHYFAAGATLFGDAARGAYQFDGEEYKGQNVEHPLNQCTQCHEVHALNVQVDLCKGCHVNVKSAEDLHKIRMDTTDYDGDGSTTEGIFEELSTMRDALYAAIQVYGDAQGTPIVYNAAAYPYFFVEKDKDGQPDKNDQGATVRYNAWTPKLLESAYNYQYSMKDPGAFAHNPKYIIQIVYDSIANLDPDAVQGMTRP